MNGPDLHPRTDDTGLLSLIADGDKAAFASFMGLHLRALTVFTARFLGNREDGEDVAQAVFLEVWRKAGQYDATKAAPRTWLYRIARNRCIDTIRRRRLRSFVGLDDGADDIAAEAPSALQTLGDRRDLQAVVHAVSALPDRQRMALLLSAVSGMPGKQIAQVLETSEGAVEQLLTRARRTLRQTVGRDDRI